MSESEFLHHDACDACGSSDALAVYSDEHTHCFSCGATTQAGKQTQKGSSLNGLYEGEVQRLDVRGIDEDTCRKYRYLVGRVDGEVAHLATYFDAKGRPTAQKIRSRNKDFSWAGKPKQALLFGQQLWAAGGRRVVVTEGEIDALSMSQAMGNRWPVVSLPNGAQGARRDLAKHLEWLDSFDEVVLMFDQDEPGQEAAAQCAELLTPGKARIASLPLKDANEMLVAGRVRELVTAAWEAARYRPDGVVEGTELWSVVSQTLPMGLSYPWTVLDTLTHGLRPREVVVLTAGTGTGKSQVAKEVAHRLALEHGQKVGIISLEESVAHAARCQMSLACDRQLHLPEVRESVSEEALRKAFDESLGTGRFCFYDHFGSVASESLLPKIRYMALALEVKWIVLDHVSIMVSAMATEGDERKRIDALMTNLRSLVEELEIGAIVISHLRKASGTPHEEGGRISLVDLRGSGAIGQIANMVIALERNQQDKTSLYTRLRVLKNRYSGETGVAGWVAWVPETGRLVEAGGPDFEPEATFDDEGGNDHDEGEGDDF